MVQRFVDGSIIGWYRYLYGDRRAANALMIKDNPELTEAELDASLVLIRAQEIVDSGEALERGIGAMSTERIRAFYESMVAAGLYRPGDVDPATIAATQFVNRRVGMDIKDRLSGPPLR